MRATLAEGLGSLLLAAAVIGSGIMAQRLCDGNAGLALLANALATGAMLYTLIRVFAPVSGAHFNPAVSLMRTLQGELPWPRLLIYIAAQTVGAMAGMVLAHTMFSLPLLQEATTVRSGNGIWISEVIATAGLLLTVQAMREPRDAAPAVALYIVAAYWFTASTSFANPALSLARGFTNTFAGIHPANLAAFIALQLAVAAACAKPWQWLVADPQRTQ